MVKLTPEREQIARYLGGQLYEIYLRCDDLYLVAGLGWAIALVRGEVPDAGPAPTETLDEFLRRESDGQTNEVPAG